MFGLMSKKYDGRYNSNASCCFSCKCGTGYSFCMTHRIAIVPDCTTFIGAPVSHMRSHLMSVEDVCKICANFAVTDVTLSEDALHSNGPRSLRNSLVFRRKCLVCGCCPVCNKPPVHILTGSIWCVAAVQSVTTLRFI